jgi:peptide/opine/nickel uptake ABC transporter family, ATP-binding protein
VSGRMLEVQDITFSYQKNGNQILEHVNLSVGPEERLGILAPSGYGKTTLLKIISGYISPDAGRILVDGEPLPQKGYCPVQMIFQHPEQAVNSRLRMREVLKEGDGISKELIEGLGIEEDWKNRFPQELSGGELQRFCIARALGKGTKYLLCDEITTMLDFITQGQIWNFLIEETKRRGIGMVIVSHSQPLLDHVCTRQIRLNENP